MPVASSFKLCPYQSEGFLGLTQAQSRVGSKYSRSGSQPMMAEIVHNYSTFLSSRVGCQFSVASVVHSVITFSLTWPMLIFFFSFSHLYVPISASWVHLSIQLLTLKSSFPGLFLEEPNLEHISYTKQYSLKKPFTLLTAMKTRFFTCVPSSVHTPLYSYVFIYK